MKNITRKKPAKRFGRISLFVSFFLFLFSFPFFSEEVVDYEFAYSLDIPEGFSVSEHTPDGMSYLFRHQNAPVSLVLKIYTDKNPKESFLSAMKSLSASYEIDDFVWRNVPCVISSFQMLLPMNSSVSKGWGIGATLPEKNASLVLLCYTEDENFSGWENFIFSSLNSLCIDSGSKTSPGIIASYAYPESGKVPLVLNISGREIRTEIGKDDGAASRFVRDMEFSVLSLYADHPEWKEAWTRYYRAIFRDSCGRLKKASFDIYSALYSECRKKNPDSPFVQMNAILLSWLQDMPYVRDNGNSKKSDFTDLVSVLQGEGSDCDSRSLLACVLLRNMGCDSCLFVSREYSHAVYGAGFDIPGAKIKVGGKDYLLCETTAKGVSQGLIASDLSVTEFWIPVTFP